VISVGYTHLRVAIEDYSRVAYVAGRDDEPFVTLVGTRAASPKGWSWPNHMRGGLGKARLKTL